MMAGIQGSADVLATLRADRVVSVVRAPAIPDVSALCRALADGGIRVVELTFTTPELEQLVVTASATDAVADVIVGTGTVRTAVQARAALKAGARFIVTPNVGPDTEAIVAAVHEYGAAAIIGALTPSEVAAAWDTGADVVKIFPARTVGPKHLSDVHGPFPEIPLIPSGGINDGNAADYLAAGALAVSAGTSVVSPDDVAAGRWDDIRVKAGAFSASLG